MHEVQTLLSSMYYFFQAGPPVGELIETIGKDESSQRLQSAAESLRKYSSQEIKDEK